jgi:hypothetical protein
MNFFEANNNHHNNDNNTHSFETHSLNQMNLSEANDSNSDNSILLHELTQSKESFQGRYAFSSPQRRTPQAHHPLLV